MNGGSSAPYLACTLFNRGGNRRAFRLPGAGGGSFPLYGGTFARSYSVHMTSVSIPRRLVWRDAVVFCVWVDIDGGNSVLVIRF